MRFEIAGLVKSSMLDYPDKIAAVVFTQGCNFKCGYCHNPRLLPLQKGVIKAQDVFDFLKTRTGKLDSVVISGGEPTLQPDLLNFILEVKKLGFLIKLDTNGSKPDVLQNLFSHLDYIAMDIKSPQYSRSIDLIMNSGVDYEFRTTVLPSLLNFSDFEKIAKLIKGAKRYYLQKFVSSEILDLKLQNEQNYSDSDFLKIIKIMEKTVDEVYLR